MPQSPAPADAAANPLTGDFQVDIAKSKDLYKRFLAMEQGARSIVASCRSEHGIHLWPVVRRAYFADFYRGNAAVYINKNLSVQIGIVEKARSIPKNFLKILTASPKNLGMVFTKKEIHARVVQGKRYDPYLDPVVQEMQALGMTPIKLQFYSGESGPYVIPPAEIPLETSESFIRFDALPPIPGYRQYVEASLEYGVPPLHPSRILQEYSEIRSHAAVFHYILAALQPKFVILEQYYNPVDMGLSLACHERGIPCVEYQHGMQDNHIMYTFQHVPRTGFEVVPQWFFTWGERPANRLRAMFADQDHHRVAVAGKAEYLAWARGALPEDKEAVDALRARVKGRKAILVPLRLDLQEHERLALVRAMAAAPRDWIWLVRQHPLKPSNELASLQDAPNVECRLATELMIDTVLSLADHVVCACSSVCLEARFLHDVPVTLLGQFAVYHYGDYIEKGIMRHATTTEEILAAVAAGERAAAPDGAMNTLTNDTTLLPALLRRL